MSNVTWEIGPITLADTVVGLLDDQLVTAIRAAAGNRPTLDGEPARRWIDSLRKVGEVVRDVVVAATWTPAQDHLAESVACSRIDDLCGIALLLEDDLESLELWSLRGDFNRPGPQGTRRDHRVLGEALRSLELGHFELLSEPLVVNGDGESRPAGGWYSADPVPLDQLVLRNSPTRVARCLASQDAIPRRLRVAAKWYSEAHWAMDPHDAALALGVALDAMVGAQHGLPGQVLATRFAHLEPDVMHRRSCSTRWNEMYSVRSKVAHGGVSDKLDDADFLRAMAQDVSWTANRLLALDARFSPSTEKDFESVMDQLRLGEATW